MGDAPEKPGDLPRAYPVPKSPTDDCVALLLQLLELLVERLFPTVVLTCELDECSAGLGLAAGGHPRHIGSAGA